MVPRAHRAIALLVLAIGVVQFFLAGLGAFGAESYDAHAAIGSLMQLLGLVVLILAAVGRREALAASAALFVLLIVQGVLGMVGDDVGFLGGLHPVNALLVLGAAAAAASGAPLNAPHGRRAHARG